MPIWRVLACAASIGAMLVPAATAAGPTVTITPFDRTRTIAASPDTCPFAIVVHSTGTNESENGWPATKTGCTGYRLSHVRTTSEPEGRPIATQSRSPSESTSTSFTWYQSPDEARETFVNACEVVEKTPEQRAMLGRPAVEAA